MGSVQNILRSVSTIILGALLYTGLNWIPIIGPALVGALCGYWVGGGFKRGFNHAIAASVLGTLIIAYVFASGNLLEHAGPTLGTFILWMLLVWNASGIVFTSIGGGLGAIGKDMANIIPQGIKDAFSPPKPKSGLNYALCPVCGQGNVEGATTCVSCGNTIKSHNAP